MTSAAALGHSARAAGPCARDGAAGGCGVGAVRSRLVPAAQRSRFPGGPPGRADQIIARGVGRVSERTRRPGVRGPRTPAQ
eukprot:2311549-Prymnesium_polylepis.1